MSVKLTETNCIVSKIPNTNMTKNPWYGKKLISFQKPNHQPTSDRAKSAHRVFIFDPHFVITCICRLALVTQLRVTPVLAYYFQLLDTPVGAPYFQISVTPELEQYFQWRVTPVLAQYFQLCVTPVGAQYFQLRVYTSTLVLAQYVHSTTANTWHGLNLPWGVF